MTSVIVDAGERRPEIFSNNFWGKEEAGFEALTSRLREAKQTCEDVRNMFHERAIIEEEYAKKLMRISKITIGNDETGTLREALEVCRQELEATAKEHITLSQKIRTELEQDVTNFIARQKETRKLQQAIVEKSLRNKKEQTAFVQKAKERYETECVKITGLLAGKNSIMGKDLEKLNLKIEKTQMAAKAADQEYAQLVKNARETTQKWNYDWRVACDKFQDLEEERIDSLKTYLWTYANLISTVCVADDESCERIRVALEHCNVEKDIQIFIRDRASGPDIPEPPNYVNFYEGPKENGVSFKRASFNRVPAYIDGGTTTPLGPSRRLSLHELQSTYNSNGNAYHTRNDSGDYDNMNIERARLYANTTLNTINNINNGEEVFEQTGEEEPVDPRAKQMLSIGDNVFEVETNKLVEQDKVAQALANMHLTDNTTDNNSDQNLTSTITSAINSTVGMTFESLKKLPKINTSTGGSISGEGNNINRRPLPVNFVTDKPQPPTPADIQQQQQQQQQQTILYHQRNNSQSRLQFNSYQLNGSPTAITPANTSTAIINGNNSSTHSLHQQPQGGIINGPGDLRRQPSEQNNNGPISSQQQQISQNMSMKSKSSQPNRDSQQQQGPGDIRRMSNSTQPSPTNTGPTQVSQQQIPGQMIPQDQILTQGQRQIISQGTSSSPNNSANLNRSDTHRTTSTTSNNSTIGIQLDVHGRVKKDDLAETFITNGGRLPPESAKFQTNPQGISQTIQQQISPQGQISSFNRQLQQMSSNQPVITPQSSYRGSQQVLQQQQIQQQQIQQQVQQQQQIQQQIQQQQQQQIVQQVLPQQVLQQPLHRANTLNSNSTLTSAFHHNQGVNANSQQQLQDSLGIQLQTRPSNLQVSVQQQQQSLPGQQINYQDPSFFNPPTMAQYQRPGAANLGGGANAQGFQQMQHVQGIQQLQRQQSQLQSYTSLQQPQQIMARSVQLQYQPLQRPVIAGHPQDNRPRTEDGKPIEFYVKALYDYQKTIPEEISFTAGDIIAVLNTHSDGWWEGEILDESRRNRGLFPSNYIEVLH